MAISAEDAIRSFRAVKMRRMRREVERRLGRGVRDSFVADVRQATALAFDAELKPVEEFIRVG